MPTMEAAVANIIDLHLRPRPGQTVVVLHDEEKAALAARLSDGLASRGRRPLPLVVPAGSPDLDAIVTPSFARDDVALVALVSRRMWLDLGLARHFAMVDGEPSLLARCRPTFADWVLPVDGVVRLFGGDVASDAARLTYLRGALPAEAPVRLTAPGGTDVRFISRHWRLCEWTEVLTSPVEESVSGRIVADASVFFARVTAPLTLVVEAGRITAIECADATDAAFTTYRDMMRRELERDPARWQLAEVGIGGCTAAKLSGVVMEDEAVRGTCHFCFGDNSRYGGANACDWHGGTIVVARPRLTWAGGEWEADTEPLEA